MGIARVLSHREIFNELILASVSAQMTSPEGVTSPALLNRDSLSEFLWSAFRELHGKDTLSWCNYEARRFGGELHVEIKTRKGNEVRKSFVLATDGRSIFNVEYQKKNGKVGPWPTNRSCRQLTAR